MNRNQITFIVIPLLLIFGYQNCQKANHEEVTEGSLMKYGPPGTQDVQMIPLQNENIEGLQFKSEEVVQVAHNNGFYSLIKNFIYDFDIRTGELIVIDEQSQTNVRYCLNDQLKSEVNALLYSSSVCKSGAVVREGLTCTQAIQDGFANLITSREQFRLGSATDGCGSNLVDLCDDNSNNLKSWFASVKAVLGTLQCQ